MRSHSWPVTSRNGVGEVMPALLTRAPTGGTEPSRPVSAFSTDISSVMSQPTPTACTPCRSPISWAASLALASSRSRMAMFQPAAARVWAVARPMPRLEPAPVMRAVLSDTDMVLLHELVYGSCGRSGARTRAPRSIGAVSCGITREGLDEVWTRRRSGGGRVGVGGPGGVLAPSEFGLDLGDDGVGRQ